MPRRGRGREAEAVQRSRRRLEEALAEVRWTLDRELGWTVGSKGALVLLLATAVGFVAGQGIRRSQAPRGEEALPER